MTRAEERQLAGIRDMIAAGKPPRQYLGLICGMIRCPVPEIRERKASRRAAPPVPVVDSIDERIAELRAQRGQEPVTPLPKPPVRVKNPKVCAAYKKAVGRCETAGPDCEGPLDYSHILAKSQGGDDIPETNGLVQCRFHHELWETSRTGWWRAVGVRLLPPARAKVLAIYPDLPAGEAAIRA
jgi:hypothetical protein